MTGLYGLILYGLTTKICLIATTGTAMTVIASIWQNIYFSYE